MQSFKTHLINEDKSRFVQKNPHLTDMQKQEIIDFIKKNNQADGKLDANKATTMTYDEYQSFMGQWQSGRKVVLKHVPIAHLKEGEDYIRVKLHTKEYLAYIPLSYATAKIFNTKDLGVCQGEWCVGHSSTSAYWDDHIVNSGEVPVYVINKESKWIVMIQRENDSFDIWDLDNLRPQPHDSIPNFNVKKELISPELSKLYDEIRTDHYDTETDVDTEAAENDYNYLIQDMANARDNYAQADEDFYSECQRIKEETKEKYEELARPLETAMAFAENRLDFAKNQYEMWKKDPTHKIISDERSNQIYMFPREFEGTVIAKLQKIYDAAYEKWYAVQAIVDGIEDVENYEMYSTDHIEDDGKKYYFGWIDEPPDEDEKYNSVNTPYWASSKYSDYFDFAEDYYGWSEKQGDSLQQDIDEYVYEGPYGGRNSDAAEVLSEHGLYDPSGYNDR